MKEGRAGRWVLGAGVWQGFASTARSAEHQGHPFRRRGAVPIGWGQSDVMQPSADGPGRVPACGDAGGRLGCQGACQPAPYTEMCRH